MKAAAILLLVVCLAALGGIGYLYFNTNVEVSSLEVIATDALTQTDTYNQLKSQLENKSFVGTLFSRDGLSDPENDVFYTYRVQVTNRTFLPVEVIELQITPITGDLLQIGDLNQYSLSSGQSTELSATILTGKQTHNARELTVSYYIWGLPFFTRLTSR